MNINIMSNIDSPIYEQIVSQIKGEILRGELKEGDALPSMRILAKELRISVITTKRAYEELEKIGFIVSITGKGSFVGKKNLDFEREERLKEIERKMRDITKSATHIGIQIDELCEMLRLIYEGI